MRTSTYEPECVLITGGAGFIGSHTAEKLLSDGRAVVIVDNFDPFYSEKQKHANLRAIQKRGKIEFYEADIRDKNRIEKAFREQPIDAVIHMAARPGPRPSVGNAREYHDINVVGTLNMLELSAQAGVGNFIFAGSSSVYTEMPTPFHESAPADRPYSPYAATKRACEMLAFTYSRLHSLPVSSLRFFTVYGPRMRPDLMIHKFTRLIDSGRTLPIYGDGSAQRDYTYIEDIVSGVAAALASPSQFEIYNLGNSKTVPLMQVVDLLERLIGKKANCRFMQANPSDAPITYADIGKAKAALGYNPTVSIEEGLEHFVKWYRQSARIPSPQQ